jgi:hypothetical protein
MLGLAASVGERPVWMRDLARVRDLAGDRRKLAL